MADTKTIHEFELERNVLLPGKVSLNKKVTAAEFDKLQDQDGVAGVDWEFRTKWLKENGHKVTRANLANVDLPAKPPKEPS